MFDEPMILNIYLPPNFEPNQSYPSLYLLHGQSQDVTLWTRLGIRETLDELILSERIQPFIVIMPQEENYLQDVEKSDFERRLIALNFSFNASTSVSVAKRAYNFVILLSGVFGSSKGVESVTMLIICFFNAFF